MTRIIFVFMKYLIEKIAKCRRIKIKMLYMRRQTRDDWLSHGLTDFIKYMNAAKAEKRLDLIGKKVRRIILDLPIIYV